MKALLYEFDENTDLRFVKKSIKKVLDEYGIEPRIKSFEDSAHFRQSLLEDANYTRARNLVSERIKAEKLYDENEILKELLTDMAVFYFLRLKEDIESGNVTKAVDKALMDVRIQLSSCSPEGEYNETWNKNNKHDWIPNLQQAVI